MHLLDFVNEIFDIAVANDVDVGVGKDMFIANIRTFAENLGDEIPYHGADHLDYKALAEHYNELYTDEELRKYNDKVKKFYFDICQLRQDGKRDAVHGLLADKVEDRPYEVPDHIVE